MNKRIKKKQWTVWSKQYNKRWKKYCQRIRNRGIRPHHPVIQMLECELIKESIEETFSILPKSYAMTALTALRLKRR